MDEEQPESVPRVAGEPQCPWGPQLRAVVLRAVCGVWKRSLMPKPLS